MAAVKTLDEGMMRDWLAAFRQEQGRIMAEGPRQVPSVCKFCLHEEVEVGLTERVHCVIDCRPDVSGGCDRWEPRYRVEDDEEENGLPS